MKENTHYNLQRSVRVNSEKSRLFCEMVGRWSLFRISCAAGRSADSGCAEDDHACRHQVPGLLIARGCSQTSPRPDRELPARLQRWPADVPKTRPRAVSSTSKVVTRRRPDATVSFQLDSKSGQQTSPRPDGELPALLQRWPEPICIKIARTDKILSGCLGRDARSWPVHRQND